MFPLLTRLKTTCQRRRGRDKKEEGDVAKKVLALQRMDREAGVRVARSKERGQRALADMCLGFCWARPYSTITPSTSESPSCIGALKRMTLPLERAGCCQEMVRLPKASDLPRTVRKKNCSCLLCINNLNQQFTCPTMEGRRAGCLCRRALL